MVSSSPHAHSGASVRRIMLDVIIALVPAMGVAVYVFGLDAVRLVFSCVVTCVACEALCRLAMRRNVAVGDLSAVVTGILLALNLPPALPTWMAVAGSVIAIAIAKQLFGGLGYNPFNPALVARAALLIARTREMTTWSQWQIPSPHAGIDAITQATPLGLVKGVVAEGKTPPFDFDTATAMDFLAGNMNGCIGEISAAALIAGGVYLLVRRCISWHTPVFFIGTVAIFSGLLYALAPWANMPPLFHLLTGGLMLGAIFMATDMVTTPVTRSGMAIFGIGCGVLTMVIRKWGGYPEGVSFAILLMNAATPLINRATKPRAFGHKRGKKKK
jgi:electron transport complex protein RnfD